MKDGLASTCKECTKIARQQYPSEAKCRKQKMAEYYKENKTQILKQQQEPKVKERRAKANKAWYDANKSTPKFRQTKAKHFKTWRLKNKAYCLSMNAAYRAAKLQRTPPWVRNDPEELEVIQWAYEWAREQELKYSTKFHVDHIVPLQGSTVSGFHCAENLAVIPAYDNMSKGNKF